MKITRKIMMWPALIALLAGCASQQSSQQVSAVREKLQTYHVNVTTFKNFKKDAGLIAVNNAYGTPPNGIWKLFGTRQEMNLIRGKFSSKCTYIVGDSEGPICKLSFDAGGNLTDLSYFTETSVLLPVVQADDVAIDLVMEKLESTYKVGNYSYAFEILYTPILQSMGGKEAGIAAAKTLEDQAKEQQITMISWKCKKPYRYIASELADFSGRIYAIIPYESVMQIAGKTLTQKSYVLGIKATSNSKWQFVNGDQLNQKIFKNFFPDFPKMVKLPQLERNYE